MSITHPCVSLRGQTATHRRIVVFCVIAGSLSVGVAGVIVPAGCMHSSQTHSSLLFENPGVSTGVVIEEDDPLRLKALAEALDAIQIHPASASAREMNSPIGPISTDGDSTESAHGISEQRDAGVTIPELTGTPSHTPPPSPRQIDVPPDAVQLIPLPKMSQLELTELLDYLTLKVGADLGYAAEQPTIASQLPAAPTGVVVGYTLAREIEGTHRLVQIGYRKFLSQPPQLWIMGIERAGDESITANPDNDALSQLVATSIASMNDLRAAVTVHDLESKRIQLSYTDAAAAVKLLKAMGVNAMADAGELPEAIDYEKLPYVIAMPDPVDEAFGLIGADQAAGRQGRFELSLTPNIATKLNPHTIAAPMTQLLVMFHPAQPQQFSRVRSLIDEHIDRPARQIFVEGMVLEISEEGLKDLGLEWELQQPLASFTAGTLSAGGVDDTLNIDIDNLDFNKLFGSQVSWIPSVRLRALIREGKAEILSRPSVLTLNNRQSTIRVGTDIPIATSQEGLSGSTNKISFNFTYIPTGISLNIRPRINEAGSEVSMLIDTVVSDTVPGADLEIRSQDGDLLASAPTVATRRVQTYARIANNTPFIIGGLVSKERTSTVDKVPLLGDMPLIGPLFRSERSTSLKREVIIVLTPYVLPDQEGILRALPQGEDQFDSFGHELFRDSYRIRTEDVFDLTFLTQNSRLNFYRELVNDAIGRDFRLADHQWLQEFAGNRFPGEQILVARMIYEVIKRLNLAEVVEPQRIIYFEGKQIGGFDVRFLDETMAKLGGGEDHASFFERFEGKALALTYFFDRTSMQAGKLMSEPVPTLSIVDCPDRETWNTLLWEMNQPDERGHERYTILLNDDSDMVRLKRAIMLKKIIQLNGGGTQMVLQNFGVGKSLLIPDLKTTQVHVSDADVARIFYATEHYYAALVKRLEDAFNGAHLALTDPALGMPDITQRLEEAEETAAREEDDPPGS